ncbi:MAG: ferritin family protein, partial [Bacteroidales bacterium]|nr:ferritin family protein [Bacteroidales bacterium]
MKEFNSINDILDFAIDAEQDAVDFYNHLAEVAKTKDMKVVFTEFAQEEIGHKTRLVKIKNEGVFTLEKKDITDLKIADYIVSKVNTTDMSYQDALVLAMKKEKSAFKLYLELSNRAKDTQMKNLFLSLAQ